jgi:folate-binding Fe-S cluster repair protein YgfZ
MDQETDTEIEATPRWASIVASGPEAEAFLQGQLSQDLTAASAGDVGALLLAPDGIVITSCLVSSNTDGYTLLISRELGDTALTRLKRFLLRTKCALELRDVDSGPYVTLNDQIREGLPGPREFAKGLTPQCFGGSFVASTVSFTKGCFTGQELVGRLDARGSSVPWRMVRASGPNEARVNEVLRSRGPAGPSGLTTFVRSGGAVVGLGFAHRSLLGSEDLEHTPDVQVEEIA